MLNCMRLAFTLERFSFKLAKSSACITPSYYYYYYCYYYYY